MRSEERLDAVRWRRPRGRAVLALVIAVASGAAVLAVWSGADGSVLPGRTADNDGGPSGQAQPGAPLPEADHEGAGADAAGSGSPAPATKAADSKGASGVPSAAAPAGSAKPAIPAGGGKPTNPAGTGKPVIPAGTVGVPIRLAEPAGLALVRSGDRVTLLRIEDAQKTTTISEAALVLTVVGGDDSFGGELIGGGLLVALKPGEARQAAVGSRHGFAVLLHPG